MAYFSPTFSQLLDFLCLSLKSQNFIYFKLLSLCFCIQKACFPIPLIICLLLQTKYTLITPEILIAFMFSLVEQTFVDFPFVFEDLSFTIHLIKKFRIVRVLVCLVNC